MDGAPATRPTDPPEPANRSRRHTRLILAFLYFQALAFGLEGASHSSSLHRDILHSILMSGGLCWWATVDARVRGHVIPMLSRSWFLLFAFFLVPGYVVWTRGWRGAVRIVLIGISWYAVAAMTWSIAVAILYGSR